MRDLKTKRKHKKVEKSINSDYHIFANVFSILPPANKDKPKKLLPLIFTNAEALEILRKK